MGNIIRLHGDPHQQVLKLLPWYANATLEPAEAAQVEAHLHECAECREALESERTLGRHVAELSVEVERGWAAMRGRIEAAQSRSRAAPVPFLRRPIAAGWALAGQAAAALLICLLFFSLPQAPEDPSYRALGSAQAAAPGNIILLFKPDATEREIRAALVLADARLVDGPTPSGAYVIRVADEGRAAALDRLQAIDQVALAEPIDPGGGR